MLSWGDSHRFLLFYTAGDYTEKIYLDKVNLAHAIPPAVCTVYFFAYSEMALMVSFCLQVQKEIKHPLPLLSCIRLPLLKTQYCKKMICKTGMKDQNVIFIMMLIVYCKACTACHYCSLLCRVQEPTTGIWSFMR